MMVEEVELLPPHGLDCGSSASVTEMLKSHWGGEEGEAQEGRVAVCPRMIHVVVQEKPTLTF